LDDTAYAEMLASTTLPNRIGATLGTQAVHAMTDVTALVKPALFSRKEGRLSRTCGSINGKAA
jgi:hypothetical protein